MVHRLHFLIRKLQVCYCLPIGFWCSKIYNVDCSVLYIFVQCSVVGVAKHTAPFSVGCNVLVY